MTALLLTIGILAGLAIGWLLAASRFGKQLQAEREPRVAAETRLEEMGKQLTAQQSLLEAARAQLSDSFKALSSDALQANSQAFVERAKQTLEPLQEALKRYEEHVRALEQARRQDYGNLDANLKSLLAAEQQLQRETGNLVNALRRPQVRGRWGEMTLRRAAELAGMSQYCDFEEQEVLAGDGGRLRPDMIVRLPAGRQVVVDAKCSLEAYLSAVEAQDEATRKTCLGQHCRQLRDHMHALASKSYQDQFASGLDFVVMFVPGESFLAAAMDEDPKLLEDSLQRKVLIASPINLIALLHAVAYGWRQEQVTENAQKISELGRQVYERVRTFTGHLQDVGKQLDRALGSYNKAIASMESRVLPMARRFREYGAAGGDELAELEPVDTQARQLTAPEAEES
jgi:DNA recombination protein RmuC